MKPLSCSVCKSGCSIPAACDRLPREVSAGSIPVVVLALLWFSFSIASWCGGDCFLHLTLLLLVSHDSI